MGHRRDTRAEPPARRAAPGASGMLTMLPLDRLAPHPDNPRLAQREELVERLAAAMAERGFGVEHAILVRPLGAAYQIVSGHQRVEAARRAGLAEVPAWVRQMDDDEAYMLLVLSNSQSELSPLEIGLHALRYAERHAGGRGRRGGLSEYARRVGLSQPYIARAVAAAEVFALCHPGTETYSIWNRFSDKAWHLYAVHSAPRRLWPTLASLLAGSDGTPDGLTVAETERAARIALELERDTPGISPDAARDAILARLSRQGSHAAPAPPGPGTAAPDRATAVPSPAPDGDGGAVPVSRDDAELVRAVAALREEYPDEDLSPQRIRRLVETRLQRVRRERAALAAASSGQGAASPSADIRVGDFRAALGDLAPGSVGLIFTDPPYPKEFLPLWRDLAAFAGRVLAPSGVLIAYTGQYHFPEVWRALSSEPELEYLWVAGLMTPGLHTQIMARRIRSVFKPLLVFAKRPFTPGPWRDDGHISEGPEKDLHEWQQSEGAALHFIAQWSPPGGLVVDPFLGSGTTASAAIRLGRRFIGCDADPAAVRAALDRLARIPSPHA